MTTVLAAIDDDASAASVLDAAKRLARLLGAEARALHAGPLHGAIAERASAADMPLDITDVPAPEGLIDAAGSPEVAVLAVGARSGPEGRRPAGRVALAVATKLGKPVLVVPPAAQPGRPLRRVLVPLDATAPTADALAETIRLAREQEVAVVVLHVHRMEAIPAFEDQPHHEREAWAREFVARYCGCRLEEVGVEVRVGKPHEHVVEVARELEVDLLALGWRRNLEGGHGAVVREALANSPVPVLLVPVTE